MGKPNSGRGQAVPRSKKPPPHRCAEGGKSDPSDANPTGARCSPRLHPPRPSKPLLVFAVVLLVLWMAFLTLLALLARKWV
jgi:hypothetical protein